MTTQFTAVDATQVQSDSPAETILSRPIGIMAVVILAYLLIFSRELLEVIRANTFFDSDDLMRLIRVRALLDGDGWFNLIEPRINPPVGAEIHWTHLLDAPIGVILQAFGLVLSEEAAVRATRVLWPAILFGLTLTLIARIARHQIGASSMLVAASAFLLSIMGAAQFAPGRLDHHNVQILLAAATTLVLIRAQQEPRHAVWAGVAMAISLGLNVENLPFFLALVGVYGLHALWVGGRAAHALRSLCFTLGIALPLVYLATNGRWDDLNCDALSRSNTTVLAATAFSGAFAAWARLGQRLFVLPALTMALGTLIVAIDYAALCQAGPLAAVDPLAMDVWLKNVTEAQPVTAWFSSRAPNMALVPALLLGSAGAVLAAIRTRHVSWALIAAGAAVALVGSLWQVRVLGTGALFAAFGTAYLAHLGIATSALSRRLSVLALVVGIPFATPIGWKMVFDGLGITHENPADTAQEANICSISDTAVLNRWSETTILSQIDLGPKILAGSHHRVLAAPYARNNEGNHDAIWALMAQPGEARELLKDRGVGLVAICPGMPENRYYTEKNSGGLLARLENGNLPAWITPLENPGGTLKIYQIR